MKRLRRPAIVVLLAFVGGLSVAGILEIEPVNLIPEEEQELRDAAKAFFSDQPIRRVYARRAVGDVKIRGTAEFEPFESDAEYIRFQSVTCVKYYSPWSCTSPEQEMKLYLPSGNEDLRVDSEVSSDSVVEIARFIKARPSVHEDGQRRMLTERETRHLTAVKRLGWWRFQVSTSDGFTRGTRMVVVRRLLSWPIGSFEVVGIEHWIA